MNLTLISLSCFEPTSNGLIYGNLVLKQILAVATLMDLIELFRFSGATLVDASFWDVDLIGNLQGADLTNTDLSFSDLSRSNLKSKTHKTDFTNRICGSRPSRSGF